MRVTFLGTGTSQGIPMIGCTCAVCQSAAPEDKRFRASIVVTHDDGVQVLVDTTPDLRSQALASQLTRVDAVVYTHSHADHIVGTTWTPIPILHGRRTIFGYRIGTFAYLTDCSHVPEEAFAQLEGLDLLVIDALRERPHPTHLSLPEAVEAARRTGARRTLFTHMCHDLGHAETNARLPEGMALAYDGLSVHLPPAAPS